MRRVLPWAIGAGVVILLASASKNASAMQQGLTDTGEPDISPGNATGDTNGPLSSGYDPYLIPGGTLSAAEEASYYGVPTQAIMDKRTAAFAFMVRASECGLSRALDDSCYTTFYGGTQFHDLSDHPVLTGEMKPVQLPAQMCVAAGFADGVCFSSAAGAYQLIVPTWKGLRAPSMLRSWSRLPDFSKESQDAAFLRQLQNLGAIDAIAAGDVSMAIQKCAQTWASLPGSTAKQNPHSADTVLAYFDQGLTLYDQGQIA